MQLENSTNSAAKCVRGKMQEGGFYRVTRHPELRGLRSASGPRVLQTCASPARPAWDGVSALP